MNHRLDRTQRVSVVIPTYNMGWCITEALESVRDPASHDEVEIVVVDDGSTDDTAEKLQAWAPHIRLVWQPNRGLAAARNTGIRHSRGDLLVLLDADDRLLPGKLARQAAWLQTNADCVAVFSDGYLVSADRRVMNLISAESPPGLFAERGAAEISRLLMRGHPFPPHCAMFRRDAALAAGLFDEALRAREDLDFWLRLARQGRFGYLPGVLVEYTVREGSMSRSSELMHYFSCLLYERIEASDEFRHRPAAERAADWRAWALELALLHDGPWSEGRRAARRYAALAWREDRASWKSWLLPVLLLPRWSVSLMRAVVAWRIRRARARFLTSHRSELRLAESS